MPARKCTNAPVYRFENHRAGNVELSGPSVSLAGDPLTLPVTLLVTIFALCFCSEFPVLGYQPFLR